MDYRILMIYKTLAAFFQLRNPFVINPESELLEKAFFFFHVFSHTSIAIYRGTFDIGMKPRKLSVPISIKGTLMQI